MSKESQPALQPVANVCQQVAIELLNCLAKDEYSPELCGDVFARYRECVVKQVRAFLLCSS